MKTTDKKTSKINISKLEIIEKKQLKKIIGGDQLNVDQTKLDGVLNLIR